MSESNKRKIWKLLFTWKLLKSAIFIVCTACFSWQSANFLQLYFTYPTATRVDISFPEVLIKPAVTLCNSNPVSRWGFCDKYPNLCQEPNNLTTFCKRNPYFCEYDTSDLVEEQHLLESPYQTNCTDYEDLWKKNNKTGPRSQEMCRERCRWNFFKSCNGCENGFSMLEKPKRMCKPGRFFSV
ncbi:uncharacterized protein NPIL_319801 [Nephila pilipes]|uniref:Uncharacterized protein n=1 Tax=Nephila pilipes TaxID=299642 RepID=A0A8X6Q2K2_NEPPI|nr:uncharacterized protein NPIL_319801 [Nephila pilipes]